MDLKKTGALIAAIRKEKGLTQEQLGEKLYVTGKAVEMGHQFVDDIQEQSAAEDTRYGDGDGQSSSVFQRGKNQTHHGGAQHHAGGKGKDQVGEVMGDLFKGEAQNGAHYGCSADAQGSK